MACSLLNIFLNYAHFLYILDEDICMYIYYIASNILTTCNTWCMWRVYPRCVWPCVVSVPRRYHTRTHTGHTRSSWSCRGLYACETHTKTGLWTCVMIKWSLNIIIHYIKELDYRAMELSNYIVFFNHMEQTKLDCYLIRSFFLHYYQIMDIHRIQYIVSIEYRFVSLKKIYMK